MKTARLLLAGLSLALITLNSCKKNSDKNDPAQDAELIQLASDQEFMSSEMDAVTTDLNIPLEASLSAREQDGQICSAALTYDTTGNTRTVTIVYDGTDCFGYRSRSGSVILSIPASTHWRDAGAQATVTYQDLDITRISDNKHVTINGTLTLTNVNGGLIFDLLSGLPSVTHAITSNQVSITFEDNTQRVWQVARQRVYTLVNGGTLTITGTHSDGTLNNIAEWGTDRFGQSFTSSIPEPLVISAACQYRLISGQIKHDRAQGSATVTFGLNQQGNPVSCPSGSFYYKLEWTGARGNTLTYIAAY